MALNFIITSVTNYLHCFKQKTTTFLNILKAKQKSDSSDKFVPVEFNIIYD